MVVFNFIYSNYHVLSRCCRQVYKHSYTVCVRGTFIYVGIHLTFNYCSGFVAVAVVVVLLSLGQAMQRKLRISSQSHGRNGGMERDEPDGLLDLVAVEFVNGSGKDKLL